MGLVYTFQHTINDYYKCSHKLTTDVNLVHTGVLQVLFHHSHENWKKKQNKTKQRKKKNIYSLDTHIMLMLVAIQYAFIDGND